MISKIEAQVKASIKQMESSKLIDLSFSRLSTQYYIYCRRSFYKNMLDRSNNQLKTQLQQRFNIQVGQIFFDCKIYDLAHSFIVSYSSYKYWPKIIKHLSFHCRFITSLEIQSCKIGDEALECFYKAEWKFIRFVILPKNNIHWMGSKILCKCGWNYLQLLDLDQNHISNKGLRQMAKHNWPNLKSLSLQANSITADGLKYLHRCNWPSLKKLDLREDFNGNIALKHAFKIQSGDIILISLQAISQKDSYSFYNVNEFAKKQFRPRINQVQDVPFILCSESAVENLNNWDQQ